ncbi:hypothetical protein BDV36DRAFT_88831 [Aspergillus pseudocaelatus]|uniref:Uncharacterized protein n=1 Tax=Aspergillus pseudocaelatus TaxID=1825620 RepID=A0ABQ6W2F2_9EURO|nr:hypothetical protein BDV36DRAFT_88831 [Aspergillus pseudocaelatus]
MSMARQKHSWARESWDLFLSLFFLFLSWIFILMHERIGLSGYSVLIFVMFEFRDGPWGRYKTKYSWTILSLAAEECLV